MSLRDVTNQMAAEMRKVLAGVREAEVRSLEREIQRGKAVFFTAAGRTAILLRPFAMRMMQYGFESHVVGETTTPRVKSDDLVVLASGRGNTAGVVHRAKEARLLGARVFVITSNHQSPLFATATHSLLIPPPRGGSFQFGTNWFEQGLFFLLECVAHRLARAKKITFEKLLLRHASLE
ncbi:MAG: SIS domain-containing protein [Verrucomicrobia bacterium]|nr:SIS domain-containing protein [Verrucomicrobiota bacterium]